MSKPDDIPQDVWDAAKAAALTWFADERVPPIHRGMMGGAVEVAFNETIARAILSAKEAERERCAKIAEAAWEKWAEGAKKLDDTDRLIGGGGLAAASLGARDIAAAIRAGKE